MVPKNTSKGIRQWMPLALVFVALGVFLWGLDLYDRTQTGEGVRSGVIVKLSYKGRFRRSWEGGLMLGGVQSGQTWAFSLDPSSPTTSNLAKTLQAAELARKVVTLRYHQHFIGPWLTDTNYLVYEALPANAQSAAR
jgi:hypothetical protein